MLSETIVTDLGLERRCNRCQEFWPVDDEFWFFTMKRGRRVVCGHCKACWSERDRSKYGKRVAA
jgi:hypothetical protein